MSVFDNNVEATEITDPYEEQPNDFDGNEEIEEDESETTETSEAEDSIPESEEAADPFEKFEAKFNEVTSKYEERIAQLEAQLAQVSDKDRNLELAGFDAAIVRLKNARKEALSLGDMEAFEAAEDQLDDVKAKKAAFEAQMKQKPEVKSPPPPEFVAWNKKNPWFGTNKEMTQVALAYGQVLEAENPTASSAQLLQMVTAKMKSKYPKAFQLPANLAKTSNTGTKQKPAGKTYHDLPRDAKMACDEFVAEKKMTQEAYVKAYFEEEGN